MRKSKRAVLFITILVLLSSLVGCSVDQNLKSLYNDNKKIAATGDSYSFMNRVGDTKDKTIEVKYSKFYGDETIWIFDVVKQGEIKVDFDSSIDSGKFKVVMITPLDEVVNVFEHQKDEGSQQGRSTISADLGRYRLKIIGDNASGEFKMEVDLSDGITIFNSSK